MDRRNRKGTQCRLWLQNPNPQQPRSSLHRHERMAIEHNQPAEANDSNSNSSFDGAEELNEDLPPPAMDIEAEVPEPSTTDGSDQAEQDEVEDSDHEPQHSEDIEASDTPSDNDAQDEDNPHLAHRVVMEDPIYPGLQKTKFEVLLMSFYLMMRHGYTSVALLDHLKFVNELFESNVLPAATTFIFDKIFHSKFDIEFHFYCPDCLSYVGMFTKRDKNAVESMLCDVCGQVCNIRKMNDGNFFIYIPIAQQLRHFMENTPNVENLIKYRQERDQDCNVISDIFDGSVFKSLAAEGGILHDALCLSIGTDGSPVFGSTHNTMYGIQFIINDLPPNMRFLKENTFNSAVWFAKKDPEMSLFFNPFVKDVNELSSKGFTWTNTRGETVTTKAVVLNCVLDSVARPKLQCLKQFKGRFGCSYCYHPAFSIPGHPQSRYVMDDNVTFHDSNDCTYTVTEYQKNTGEFVKVHNVKDRTNDEIRHDIETVFLNESCGEGDHRTIEQDDADDEFDDEMADGDFSDDENIGRLNNDRSDEGNGTDLRGLKGTSVLYFLAWFNLVYGFTVEYLHCTLLGVCKQLASYWFDSKYSKEPFSIRQRLAEVNQRFKNIKPPSSVSRRPRTLDERALWKGNEWRVFLLYYSLPCLVGIMKPEYIKHHCLLVSAIHILLQEKITLENLHKAGWYLTLYVTEFQKLYGRQYMSYNIHLHLHLAKCVEMFGPLWGFSAFTFESGNGFLVSLVKGTVAVANQIAEKYCKFQSLRSVVSTYNVSEKTMEFCKSLLPFRFMSATKKINGVTLLGLPKSRPFSVRENSFIVAGNTIPLFTYDRMILNRVKYHTSSYGRQGSLSNDSIAKLSNGSYVVIERIFCSNNDNSVSALVCIINVDTRRSFVSHASGANASHIKICSNIATYGNLNVIDVTDIVHKSVLMAVTEEDLYLADIPNTFERD